MCVCAVQGNLHLYLHSHAQLWLWDSIRTFCPTYINIVIFFGLFRREITVFIIRPTGRCLIGVQRGWGRGGIVKGSPWSLLTGKSSESCFGPNTHLYFHTLFTMAIFPKPSLPHHVSDWMHKQDVQDRATGDQITGSWKDFLSATTQCKIIFTSSLRLQNKGGWLRLWVFSFISIFFSLSLDRSTHEYNKSSLCLVS